MDYTCIFVLTTKTNIWLVRCFSSLFIFYYIFTSQILCTDFKWMIYNYLNYFVSVDRRLYIYLFFDDLNDYSACPLPVLEIN